MTRGLPTWVEIGLLPFLNLCMAFLVTGLVVLALGENPIHAAGYLVYGAFGYAGAWGYTLFYTTNFIFTGLAVALAFHAGLFNIGGEGQAVLGGVGAGVAALAFGPSLGVLALPLAVLAAALFGAFWGFVPGWLAAKRGSHVVITTIMLNFVAAALLTYLMVNVLIVPGSQIPESATFATAAWMPSMRATLNLFGADIGRSPLNYAFVLALVACVAVWAFIWKTRKGYELRVVGQSEPAARYAGIGPGATVILAMTLSGALAGMMAINEVLGAQHRIVLGFSGGYGFVGIAVALMGRSHPLGVALAALLFGALYQGGSELAFDMPAITRDMVVFIQGLVILFAGALEHMFRPALTRLFAKRAEAPRDPPTGQPARQLPEQGAAGGVAGE